PRGAPFEAVEVVRLTHVVLAALAEPALPARHDLLGYHAVSHRNAPARRCFVVEFDDAPCEFVPGNHHALRPRRPLLIPPELGGPVVALQIAGADAARFDSDQRFTGPAFRHRDLFQPVVVWSVTNHGLHLLGDLFGHL